MGQVRLIAVSRTWSVSCPLGLGTATIFFPKKVDVVGVRKSKVGGDNTQK
jgi:hypothetical protein